MRRTSTPGTSTRCGPCWRTSCAINYFSNYGRLGGWRLVPGMVDRKPALLAFDPDDMLGTPIYFVVLGWDGDRVVSIRDFRYARYAMEGAEILVLGQP